MSIAQRECRLIIGHKQQENRTIFRVATLQPALYTQWLPMEKLDDEIVGNYYEYSSEAMEFTDEMIQCNLISDDGMIPKLKSTKYNNKDDDMQKTKKKSFEIPKVYNVLPSFDLITQPNAFHSTIFPIKIVSADMEKKIAIVGFVNSNETREMDFDELRLINPKLFAQYLVDNFI